jgi:N-acetylglucosamine malate deacetylase 2
MKKAFFTIACRVAVLLLAAGGALAQAPAHAERPQVSAAEEASRDLGHHASLPASPPRVLIVVAHPDDESCFAATVYEITHNLGGTVDQLVITNGEGGFHYSLLAESYYGAALTDEAVGRAALPEIRKRELLEAGQYLGINDHFFLNQRDVRNTKDIDEVLQQHWQPGVPLAAVGRRLATGHYDFVFTLFPSPETHGAHKAATITALEAVRQMAEARHRPVVLGCQTAHAGGPAPSRKGFESSRHPFQVLQEAFVTDRNVKFGFNNALSYQIIVSWVAAAHKSQGAFQAAAVTSRADLEEFVILEGGAKPAAAEERASETARARRLFEALAERAPHPRGVESKGPAAGRESTPKATTPP